MAVEFVCRNCNTRFTEEEGERARCPKCMRVHGVDAGEVSTAAGGESKGGAAGRSARRGRMAAIVAVAVLGLGGGGYLVWKAQRGGGRGSEVQAGKAGEAPIASLGIDPALAEALRKAGVSEEGLVAALGSSPAMVAKAKEVLAGKGGAPEQAAALWSLAEGWLKGKAGKPGFEELLRVQLVRGAPRAFEDLEKGAPGPVYGLEVTAALLSLARAGGLQAWGFELATGGGKVRSEATPQLANLGVALYPGGDKSAKPFVVDVAAGRVVEGAAGRRLEDAQVAAHLYVARAGHFFLKSDGNRANRETEWALKLDGESPAVAASRGIVLMAFGQVEQGVSQLRRAAELGAVGARWQVMLCLGLLRAEQGDDAVVVCKKGVEREPGSVGARLALGYAYLAVGDGEKALQAVEGARKVDETDPEVHKALAQVFDQKGQREKAKASLEQALRLDPKTRGVHLLRGLMAMKDLDYEGASQSLHKEVELDAENERLRALLATTLFRAGKRDEAEKVLGELKAGSKDPAVTAQLIASVRSEAGEDEDDADGGLEEDEDRADGGAGVPAAGLGVGGGGLGSAAGGGAAAGGAGVLAPSTGSADEDGDDGKEDEKDDGREDAAPRSSGGFELPRPGEGKSAPRFFDLGKKE